MSFTTSGDCPGANRFVLPLKHLRPGARLIATLTIAGAKRQIPLALRS